MKKFALFLFLTLGVLGIAFASTTTGQVAVSAGNEPIITAQSQSQTAISGRSLSLSVMAIAQGGGTLTYQWFKNGEVIVDAVNPTFSFVPNNQGTYNIHVVITDTSTGAFVTSNTIEVQVYQLVDAPSFNWQILAALGGAALLFIVIQVILSRKSLAKENRKV